MAHPKWLRFIEPLFPVVIIAAGVALAPAFLLSGDTPPAAPTTAMERFQGQPVVVKDAYVGCQVADHFYSDAIIPSWHCGKNAATQSASRDVASLPSAEENRQ